MLDGGLERVVVAADRERAGEAFRVVGAAVVAEDGLLDCWAVVADQNASESVAAASSRLASRFSMSSFMCLQGRPERMPR